MCARADSSTLLLGGHSRRKVVDRLSRHALPDKFTGVSTYPWQQNEWQPLPTAKFHQSSGSLQRAHSDPRHTAVPKNDTSSKGGNPLLYNLNSGLVGMGYQHQKLVPTNAPANVAPSRIAPQDLRELLEHRVASFVPKGVVHFFEFVKVREEAQKEKS